MVKVIIQTEHETIVKEGDFFFGSVVSDEADGYVVNDIAVGEVNTRRIPKIVAETMVDLVKKASGPNKADQMAALVELGNRINGAVKKELYSNKDVLISVLGQFLDEIRKESR